MVKYIIHTCNQRRWYVDRCLVPSLLAQGISIDNIVISQDTKEIGCLQSYMNCFSKLTDKCGCWHIQDDIIISPKFAHETTLLQGQYPDEIMCGICTRYDKYLEAGVVPLNQMWYSFPCIYIPNKYAVECAKWFDKVKKEHRRHLIDSYIESKKCEDEIFKLFLKENYSNISVVNIKPNLVNHIDYLIGGSVVNERKEPIVLAKYWDYPEVLKRWEKILCQ